MRGNRYSEEKIRRILGEIGSGTTVAATCCKYNVSEAAVYRWHRKFRDMDVAIGVRVDLGEITGIALIGGMEVWFLPPLGVIRVDLFQSSQREKELDVGRIFVPATEIVVERDSPILNGNECGPIGVGRGPYIAYNRLFCLPSLQDRSMVVICICRGLSSLLDYVASLVVAKSLS